MISRQATIDAFLTELTKRERKNLLHTWSTVEVKYFVVDMLEKLPSAEPKQRWIPCSERLPEEMGTYMTTIDYGKHGLAVGQRYYYGKYLGWGDERVIAWMPLPEPYKAESEEV